MDLILFYVPVWIIMGVWKSKIWTNKKKKKKTGRFRNRVGNYPSVDKIKLTPTSELIHWIRPRMNDVHNLPHVGMRFPRPNNNLVCKGNCCLYSNNLCHVNKKKKRLTIISCDHLGFAFSTFLWKFFASVLM